MPESKISQDTKGFVSGNKVLSLSSTIGAPGMTTGGPESVTTAQPPSMVSSHSPASTSSVSSSGSYGGYQNRVGPSGPPPPRSIYHNSNQPPGEES